MTSPRLTIASIIVLIVVAGCSPGGASSPAPSADGMVDATGDWQLTSGVIDGAPFPIVADAPITLTVQGTQVGGRSACNHYSGEIVVENGQVKLRSGGMTQMACPDPVMTAEAAFHVALGRIAGATRDGDRLILSGPGVELTFDRMAPVPVGEMVGTDWVLESLISGDAVSSVAGERATLRFDPRGTFKGSTGCRTFRGRWVLANGGVMPTDLGMDQTECPAQLAEQDSHVVGVLEGFRASVDGQQLTLTGERGEGLIYRAD
jgi:heat shock protein HslJ